MWRSAIAGGGDSPILGVGGTQLYRAEMPGLPLKDNDIARMTRGGENAVAYPLYNGSLRWRRYGLQDAGPAFIGQLLHYRYRRLFNTLTPA